MKQNIEIVRGTTNRFEVSITTPTGALYDLKEGEFVVFGIKKNIADDEYLVQKKITTSEAGICLITLLPTDTENLECTDYYYDCGLQSGKNFYNIIEPSVFTLIPSVTRYVSS